MLDEFTEVESGRKAKRPILIEALKRCQEENATLLIAKLDRLGRNVVFISTLMQSNVDFIAVDNPNANKLIVHIMAAFAEYERDQISARTKDALNAAKKRGVELGKYGKYVLSKRNKQKSEDFIKSMIPKIKRLRREGHNTVRAITDELNRLKVLTFHNKGKWHLPTVHKIIKEERKHSSH